MVLSKGLSYVPTTTYDSFNWIKDINLFVRKLKWHKVFRQKDRKTCDELGITLEDLTCVSDLTDLLDDNDRDRREGPFTNCRMKSTLMPPTSELSCTEVFTRLVTEELKLLETSNNRPNLTRAEFQALKSLETNKSLVIKASDKGGNTVVMGRTAYTAMCQKILDDKLGYEVLSRDPTMEYQTILFSILKKSKGK